MNKPAAMKIEIPKGSWWLPVGKVFRSKGGPAVLCRCLMCGVTESVQRLRSIGMKCTACHVKTNKKYRTHGDSQSCSKHRRLYEIWRNMKGRCQRPSSTHYKSYGGRGIKVCRQWQEYEKFKKWALQNGYHDSLSIERKDVDGDYSPGNCAWIPGKLQARNKQNTVRIKYKGTTRSIAEWAEVTGIKAGTLMTRYRKGVPPAKMFSAPIKGRPGVHNNKTRKDAIWIDHNGERKTLMEWSRDLNIPKHLLYNRVKYGWPTEKLFKKSTRSK